MENTEKHYVSQLIPVKALQECNYPLTEIMKAYNTLEAENKPISANSLLLKMFSLQDDSELASLMQSTSIGNDVAVNMLT